MKSPEKLDPKVFVEAARMVGELEETFSCIAVSDAESEKEAGEYRGADKHRAFLEALYESEGVALYGCWFGRPDELRTVTARVLTLLFVAELVKQQNAKRSRPVQRLNRTRSGDHLRPRRI